MENYFTLSEFYNDSENPSQEILDKIKIYHIDKMNPIRHRIGKPVQVSQKSGYRSYETEIKRGRSGNSQHCFKGKGAVDYVYTPELLEELKLNSDYTRICYYPHKGFIHCDYKAEKRRYYEADSTTNKWEFKCQL